MRGNLKAMLITILLVLATSVVFYVVFPFLNLIFIVLAFTLLTFLFFIRKIVQTVRIHQPAIIVHILTLILPTFLAYLSKDVIATIACSIPSRVSVHNVDTILPDTKIAICGYLKKCAWLTLGVNQYTWEVCVIRDPLSNEAVLLYNYNVTESNKKDNLEYLTSLSYYSPETLVVIPTEKWRNFSIGNCPNTEICNSSYITSELAIQRPY